MLSIDLTGEVAVVTGATGELGRVDARKIIKELNLSVPEQGRLIYA